MTVYGYFGTMAETTSKYTRDFSKFPIIIRAYHRYPSKKLNNLLPHFFCVYTNRHLIDTYSSFCVIVGGEFFFVQSCSASFFLFFFCSTGYVYSMTSLTLSDSSTKFQGNRISRYESYPIFLFCIKRCAIASHNLLTLK